MHHSHVSLVVIFPFGLVHPCQLVFAIVNNKCYGPMLNAWDDNVNTICERNDQTLKLKAIYGMEGVDKK